MIDSYRDFYKSVYSQDNPRGDAHGWIQWKGTDVCIDLHCKCGYHGHFDGDFLYHYQCPACGATYAMGCVVKMIPLTEEQAKYVNKDFTGFKTCDIESEPEQLNPQERGTND